MKKLIILSFVQFQLLNCFSQKWASSLEAVNYNSKTNSTDYSVLPLGSVSLPGIWTKHHYNKISAQQFFINKDTIQSAIAFTKCNMYEFSNKNLKDFEFVKVYYEWDSKYLAENSNSHREIIISDSLNQYIIWRLFDGNIDTYYLFGNRKCIVHNYCVTTKKWANEQKIKFLQDLYLKK